MSYQPASGFGLLIRERSARLLRVWGLVVLTTITLGGGVVRAQNVGSVDLKVSIKEDSLLPLLNELMTYTIVVTNKGPDAATGVVLVDQLPYGSLFLAANSDVGTHVLADGKITWTIGGLDTGSAATLQVQVTLPLLGSAVNTVNVTANETDLNPGDNAATSSVTTLLGGLPQILSQPESQNALLGLPVSLAVSATSDLPMRYQWRLNGINIPGATNETFSLPSFQAEQGGSYSVLVINDLGVVASNPAQLSPALSLGLPFVDNFASRKTVTGLTVVGLGENLTATVEPDEPQHDGKVVGKTVWVTWKTLLGGIATVRTTGSTFDTVLAVYSGTSLQSLTKIASDDDAGGFGTSLVTFNAVAGQDYQIAVAGYNGACGLVSLILGCEITGDRVPMITTQPEGKTVALGSSATLSVQATGSNLTYQWLRNGVAVPGATGPQIVLSSVNYDQVGAYQVRVSNGKRAVTSTIASLQMFIPGPGEAFQDVRAEDKLTDLLQSLLGILLPGDGLITLGSSSQSEETSALKTTKYSKVPAKEPTVESTARGYTGTHVFSTYGSTSQSDEPNHCDDPGGSSEWVAYQPPEDGVLTIDTDGSDFDTILAVYFGSGSSFESLQSVGCDDNSGSNGLTSKVVFDARADTTYFIAVDGKNGQFGTVVLNYNLKVPPAITTQASDQIVSTGSTVELTVGATGHPSPQIQWFLNNEPLQSATSATLVIENFTAADEGAYQLVAQNDAGQATSDPVSVLIGAPLKLESIGMNADKLAGFKLVGVHSTTFLIQASANLRDWTTVATNYSDTGILSFLDCHSTNHPCRFYRAVPQD